MISPLAPLGSVIAGAPAPLPQQRAALMVWAMTSPTGTSGWLGIERSIVATPLDYLIPPGSYVTEVAVLIRGMSGAGSGEIYVYLDGALAASVTGVPVVLGSIFVVAVGAVCASGRVSLEQRTPDAGVTWELAAVMS